MNSLNHLFKISVGFFLLFIPAGCLDYTITTQVMPDGSLERTLTIKGDSASVYKGSLKAPVDTTWKISTFFENKDSKDTLKGKVFVYEANKRFQNCNQLNAEFYSDSSFVDHTNIKATFKKRFHWFYTYYFYTETYKMLFPFHSESINKYMSEAEQRIYKAEDKEIYYDAKSDSILFATDSNAVPKYSKQDSAKFSQLKEKLEKKFENWVKTNVLNDYYDVVHKALINMGISTEKIQPRDSFINWMNSNAVAKIDLDKDSTYLSAASVYFKVDSNKLRNANQQGFTLFRRKLNASVDNMESFTNKVLMPGVIIRTNSKNVDVNVATWAFESNDYYSSDYTMFVVSRSVNRPFIFISGFILVLLLGWIVFKLIRK